MSTQPSLSRDNTAEATVQLETSQGSVILAIVSSSSGIIIEFIGATFIFLYRSTIAQALKYVDKLEKMNNVGMAMQILDSVSATASGVEVGIPEEIKVIEAKIWMAEHLLRISQEASGETSPTSTPPSA